MVTNLGEYKTAVALTVVYFMFMCRHEVMGITIKCIMIIEASILVLCVNWKPSECFAVIYEIYIPDS
jgi:hypothetical protein